MTTLILNDAPYGTERSYNGLRIALSLSKKNEDVRVFLMGDAVSCGVDNQQTPNGYYNIGRMIKSLLQKGGQVNAGGSCCDARGVLEKGLIEGVIKSDLETSTSWIQESSLSLVF